MRGQGAIALVALRTWEARWRQHLLLVAAVSLTVAMVLAVLLGADRSATAMDRLREDSKASDVLLGVGEPEVRSLLERVTATPSVLEAGVVRELFVRPKGAELFPDYNFLPLAPLPLAGAGSIDIPLIVEGRASDQARVDEVTMSEKMATDLDVQVGDRFVLESMTSAWVDVAYNGGDPGPPDGPEVEVELVGLARTPADFGRYLGVLHLTAAFADRYRDQVRTYAFVAATATPGKRSQLVAGQDFTAGASDNIDVMPSPNGRSKAVQDSLNTLATALRLVGLTAGLAGLTVVGLLMARVAREAVSERETLVAIGWTRDEVVRLSTLVLVPAVVTGGTIGLLVGAFASPFTLMRLAAAIDPGGDAIAVNWGVLAAVALGSTGLLTGLLAVTAVRVGRSTRRARPTAPAAPRLQRPLPLALGIRRALFGAPDRGGRLSRSAAAAVTAGVVVAIAALVIGSSIERLQDDPTLSGQGPADQRLLDAGEDLAVYERAMTTLEADPRAVDLEGFHVAFGVRGPDAMSLPVLVFDARRGDGGGAVLRGRFPIQADEVAIGPASLKTMGLDVGDEIELQGADGSAQFEIVGVALFPEGDFTYDAGAALTVAGARFLGGVEATAIHGVVFDWGPGVDWAAADAELTSAGFNVLTSPVGLVPPAVSNLGQVRGVAPLVAGLVLVLGLLTALYAVTITGRLRRREVGTLRALGLTPRAIATMTEVHGVLLGLVGIVLGLPIGVAAGRQVWSLIAARAYVVDHPVVGWDSMGWVAGTALLSLVVVGLPLGVREARQPPAAVLRTE